MFYAGVTILDYRIISHGCVALTVHKSERLSLPQAESAVREALSVCGYEPWPGMEIAVFEGRDGALLLACPGKAKAASAY